MNGSLTILLLAFGVVLTAFGAPLGARAQSYLGRSARGGLAAAMACVLPWCLAAGVAWEMLDSHVAADWAVLALLTLSFFVAALFLRPLRTRSVKFTLQIGLALLAALLGDRIPVTAGRFPVVEVLVTAFAILAMIHLVSVVNIIDGFASVFTFLAAGCVTWALVLIANRIAADSLDDAFGQQAAINGAVFGLAVCGASLGFFIVRRPSAHHGYSSDPAVLCLSTVLAMVCVRLWTVYTSNSALLTGAKQINPIIFLPVVASLPILAMGIHLEKMALYRRQRLALILIAAGHLPYWIPVVRGEFGYIWVGLLAMSSAIAWSVAVTQGKTLRGWSIRVMAEPIADVIRCGLLIVSVQLVVGWALDLSLLWILASGILTTVLLVGQVTWWRRRVAKAKLPHVMVFGTRNEFHRAHAVLDNCADIYGREAIQRARIGPGSKHLRTRVAEHLRLGDTVVILDEAQRDELESLRPLGDLVFGKDCLLLQHVDEGYHFRPRVEGLFEFFNDAGHRMVALVGLMLLSPIMIGVALLIKIDDNGPVLFRQNRLGANGRPFAILKFRSMRMDAPVYGESPRAKRDPRITRIGYLLRKLSLDELPQLINVLRGEMRLVGPRPEMPFICDGYTARQRKRLEVPPGLTGLWQISPHRNDPIHDHVEYDLAYRHARSPILDLAIIIATMLGGVATGY